MDRAGNDRAGQDRSGQDRSGSGPRRARRVPEGVQGASEEDLRRYPPRTETCARIRELLRDHADGDLSDHDERLVDEHVHECRACSLALGRAELEVLRIARALAGLHGQPSLGAAFTARIADAVRAELELETDADLDADLDPEGELTDLVPPVDLPEASPQFTDRVMEVVRETLGEEVLEIAGDSPRHPAGMRGRPQGAAAGRGQSGRRTSGHNGSGHSSSGQHGSGMRDSRARQGKKRHLITIAAVSIVTCILGFGLAWVWYDRQVPLRTRVLSASGARATLGGTSGASAGDPLRHDVPGASKPSRMLRKHDTVGAGEEITTEPTGSCMLQLPLRGAEESAMTFVTVQSASHVRSEGAGVRLLDGEMVVRCGQEQMLPIGVATLTLQPGEYRVAAHELMRLDQAVSPLPFTTWRIECKLGTALLRRSGSDPAGVPILAGTVAHFDAWSPVRVEEDPATVVGRVRAAERAAAERRDPQAGPVTAYFVGRIVERPRGVPVARALVRIRVASGSRQGLAVQATTDERGEYRFGSTPELEGAQALIDVVPSTSEAGASGGRVAGAPRLGWGGPRPLRLPGGSFGVVNPDTNAHELRLDEVALGVARTLGGRVRGADARPLGGVRVWACRHDELAGSLVPLPGSEATSDQDGRFEVSSPPDLGPEVSCLLLARLGGDTPRAFSVPSESWADRSTPLELVLPAGREARVEGLRADAAVDVAEGLPSLPLQSFVRRQRVRADAQGRATLSGVASGPLWLLAEPQGQWRALEKVDGAEGLVLRLGNARLAGQAAAALEGGSGAASVYPEGSNGLRWPRLQDRYGVPSEPEPPGALERNVTVLDPSTGGVRPGTQLFLVSPESAWTFLGASDATRSLRIKAARERRGRLVGVAPDGAIGIAQLDPESIEIVFALRQGGAVELAPPLRPQPGAAQQRVTIGLKLLGEELSGVAFYRCADEAGQWIVEGLPAGDYEVALEDGRTTRCRIDPHRRTIVGADTGK